MSNTPLPPIVERADEHYHGEGLADAVHAHAAAVTREKDARIKVLEEEVATVHDDNIRIQNDVVGALRERVAALEEDALRYRFLREDFSVMGANIDGNHAWAYRRNFSLRGPTLDAAIDAALAARKGG